jgi:hypothetical protein
MNGRHLTEALWMKSRKTIPSGAPGLEKDLKWLKTGTVLNVF